LNKPKALPKSKIIVHCLVKNEERFIWYALQSVLPYVDHVIVWDTGSTDKTLDIIRSIKSSKISLKTFKSVSATTHTKLRQQMLQTTPKDKYDWLMILDGDEVWPEKSIKKVLKYLSSHQDIGALVVKTTNVVGDIYHALPESAGQYVIAGRKGNFNIRFINLKLPGLTIKHPHGRQTYTTKGIPLQQLSPSQLHFLDVAYIHTTHLVRSSLDQKTLKRSFKFKYELGNQLDPKDLPQVFFQDHPSLVPDVTTPMTYTFFLKALILTPIKRLRRALITPPSGY